MTICNTAMESTHNQPVTRPHWRECLPDLRERLMETPRLLVASDFDGTLSALVEHPADAMLCPGALPVLTKLAALHPRVRLAFLSGRQLTDLTERLPIDLTHAILAGNHGLELDVGGELWNHPAIGDARGHLETMAISLQQRLGHLAGFEIEDKGASLSLHYRRLAAEDRAGLRAIVEAYPLPDNLRLHEGKMVYELRPRVAWHKGFAMRRIVQELGLQDDAVIFLGDDVTDDDVFRELDDTATTVHVGSGEASSCARFNANDPADAVEFLKTLAGQLGAGS